MATFIAQRIMLAAKTSLAAGQAKYRSYLIATSLYLIYKADVDTILATDGYGDCIITA